MEICSLFGSFSTRRELYQVIDAIAKLDARLQPEKKTLVGKVLSHTVSPLMAFATCGCVGSNNLHKRLQLISQKKALEGQLVVQGRKNAKVIALAVASVGALYLLGKFLVPATPGELTNDAQLTPDGGLLTPPLAKSNKPSSGGSLPPATLASPPPRQ